MSWTGESMTVVGVRVFPTDLKEAEVSAGIPPIRFADLEEAVEFLARSGVQKGAPLTITHDGPVTIFQAPAYFAP